LSEGVRFFTALLSYNIKGIFLRFRFLVTNATTRSLVEILKYSDCMRLQERHNTHSFREI